MTIQAIGKVAEAYKRNKSIQTLNRRQRTPEIINGYHRAGPPPLQPDWLAFDLSIVNIAADSDGNWTMERRLNGWCCFGHPSSGAALHTLQMSFLEDYRAQSNLQLATSPLCKRQLQGSTSRAALLPVLF